MKKLLAHSPVLLATLWLGACSAQTSVPATPPAAAPAATAGANNAGPAQVLKTLRERFPNIPIENVQPSQWPWLYEVITDSEMFYADVTGDYVFYGKVLDTRSRTDLTTKRWNELSQVSFDALPLDTAIKHVRGDGSRKVAVFSDPHCPYCVRLEKALAEMTNITVYTFLYPIESLHPGATATARNIWCSPDRAATWTAWMINKKTPPSVSCDASVVDSTVKLGEKLKVSGTPTLFFADGHRVPGFIGKDELEAEFKSVNSASP